jgi:hypothetical protein
LLGNPTDELFDGAKENRQRADKSDLFSWSACTRLNNVHALALSVMTVSPANEADEGDTELISGCGPISEIEMG